MFGKKKEILRASDEAIKEMSLKNPIPLTINGQVLYLPEGLSKREQFALAALQGLLASGIEYTRPLESLAFEYADDMINESEKSK